MLYWFHKAGGGIVMNQPHWMDHLKTLPKGKYRAEIQRYLLLLLIPVVLMVLLYINVNHVVTQQAEEYAELTVDHFMYSPPPCCTRCNWSATRSCGTVTSQKF